MGMVIGDNFDYKGKKPLDARMLFDTIADMKAYSENYLPDITLAFNKEDGKMYVFNRENDVDTTTGKWRVFEGGEGTESVYLTQDEFDTLTPAEQDDPTKDYYITSNGQPVPVEGIKITDMDDVSITAPLVDDETLVFDEQTQVFKNKDINSYFKDTEEKSVTLGGSNNSTNGIYGMLFPNRKIYLKDITITFNTEETSYNWYIYRINGSVAVGATVTVIDSGTGVVDQPLTVNHRFKEDEVFAIGDAATFKYGQQGQSDYALIRFNGNTIQQVLTGFYYNCTYTYEEYVDKYLTIEEAEKISSNILTGKKIMLLGDSMTAGHSTPVANRRATILGEKNNMTVDNRASNGAYMYDDETSGYKDVSIYKKVCDTTATNYIPDSAFEGVDYIIVYGGTNDVKSGSVTLGDVDSNDPSDFCGAVNAICNTLQTRAPSAHIGFITPLVYANSKTTSLAFNKAIKDVCAKYSIPVYDQGTESGINRGNATIVSTLTLGDGIHLNNAGHAFVEQKYEAFIRRI